MIIVNWPNFYHAISSRAVVGTPSDERTMPRFRYLAVTLLGKPISGEEEAEDKNRLVSQLWQRKLFLIWWAEILPEPVPAPAANDAPSENATTNDTEQKPILPLSEAFSVERHFSPIVKLGCLFIGVLGLVYLWWPEAPPPPIPQPEGRKQLMRELNDLGFYRYVDRDDQARVLATDMDYATPLMSKASRRLYWWGEEQWDQGAAKRLFDRIQPFLDLKGIPRPSIAYVDLLGTPPGGRVKIRERSYVLFNNDEWGDGSYKVEAPRRLLRAVNDILADASSAERAYWYPSGRDSRVIFLTSSMFQVLQKPNPDSIWKGVEEL